MKNEQRLIDANMLKQCYTGSNGMDNKADYASIQKMIDAQPTVIPDLTAHGEQIHDATWEAAYKEGYQKGWDDAHNAITKLPF